MFAVKLNQRTQIRASDSHTRPIRNIIRNPVAEALALRSLNSRVERGCFVVCQRTGPYVEKRK